MVLVELEEVGEGDGLHVLMIDHVEAEVEEGLVLAVLRLQQGPDVELEFVDHALIDDAIGIDQMVERSVARWASVTSMLRVPEALA